MDSTKRVFLLLCLLVSLEITDSRQISTDYTQLDKTGRSLTEEGNLRFNGNISHDKIERIDPLKNFNKYKGGYNITNKHYWSSLAFTGIYGYSIAILWLLGGAIFAGIMGLFAARIKNKVSKRRMQCYFWPMTVGVFLAVLMIVASALVLLGCSEFYSRANTVKTVIAETADEASNTIYKVTGPVKNIEAELELYGDTELSDHLNVTAERLENDASKIQKRAENTVGWISVCLKILRATTIVMVLLNLFVLVALLGSHILLFRRAFTMLLTLCWMLTFLFCMCFGIYYFLDVFAGDTCTALKEYRDNSSYSTLSEILPCSDQLSTNYALLDTRARLHDVIDQVNANISQLQSSPTFQELKFVCNPFSAPPEYNYQPENCSMGTVKIGDIPKVLKKYTCLESDEGTCGVGRFIPTQIYSTVIVFATSVQDLLNAFPEVERLVDCQMVKDAFSEVLLTQCKPLERYAKVTWASLAVLSLIMVFLVMYWIILARQRVNSGSMQRTDHTTLVHNIQEERIDNTDTETLIGLQTVMNGRTRMKYSNNA